VCTRQHVGDIHLKTRSPTGTVAPAQDWMQGKVEARTGMQMWPGVWRDWDRDEERERDGEK